MEIERDESVRGYELTDYSGEESQVFYCKKGYSVDNPLYRVGFGKRLFVVISVIGDGGKRVNRLLLNDKLLKRLI